MDLWNILERTAVRPEKTLEEVVGQNVQKAAMDWLSITFRGRSKMEIEQLLRDRSNALYDDWATFASRAYGFNNQEVIQSGWEKIVNGGLLHGNPHGEMYY